MNPAIVWSFALKRFPDLSEELADDTAKSNFADDTVFEACARNPYAENFIIPCYELIENAITQYLL